MRPDEKVFEAAAKLQSAEMSPLLDWLKWEHRDVVDRMAFANLATVQVEQGRAQQLNRILDLIKSSQDVLDKKRA